MKIAVISDIHGNYHALERVIQYIDDEKVDSVICLGDFVGYGPMPNEAVETIRRRNILAISGNYDASVVAKEFVYIRDTETNSFSMPWTNAELKEENIQYLKNLPQQITIEVMGKTITFVHGSTRKINEYLKEGSTEAEEVMKQFNGDVLVCAHTHIPYVKECGGKLLINEGSVGKPKIGRPNSTFLMLNVDENGVQHEIVELEYDYEKTMKAMILKGFPEKLVESIKTGME